MKVLFISDAIPGLNPSADTGISMARGFLDAGHSVYWAMEFDLVLRETSLSLSALPLLSCAEGELPAVGEAQEFLITDFDAVSIRKDPPFDEKYFSLCWFLSLYEDEVVMVNPPSLLLKHHEKLIPFQALRSGHLQPEDLVLTRVYSGEASSLDFESEKYVTKPWLGHGGEDVSRHSDSSAVVAYTGKHSLTMVQPFIPEISKGDHRETSFSTSSTKGFLKSREAWFLKISKPVGAVTLISVSFPST